MNDLLNIKLRNIKYLIKGTECRHTLKEVFNELLATMFAEGIISLEEMQELLITE